MRENSGYHKTCKIYSTITINLIIQKPKLIPEYTLPYHSTLLTDEAIRPKIYFYNWASKISSGYRNTAESCVGSSSHSTYLYTDYLHNLCWSCYLVVHHVPLRYDMESVMIWKTLKRFMTLVMIYGLSAARTMFKADAISTSTLNRSLFTNLSPLF